MAGPIVDLVVLRGLLADTALRPGVVLAARVLERDGPRGMLLLNGVRVAAQLPPQLAAGDALRVRVTESTSDRVTLQVLPRADGAGAPAAAPQPPVVGLPLPGGARFRVEPDSAGVPRGDTPSLGRSVALRFDSPALGRLDFLLTVDEDVATARVAVAAGAAPAVRSAANELRGGLAAATGRAARVEVAERAEEGVDVRA